MRMPAAVTEVAVGARRAAVVLVAALLLLVGCSAGVPDTPPSIRGVVTSVEHGEATSMRVVWTEDPSIGPQADYDAAQVTLDSAARAYRRASDEAALEPLEATDVAVGDIVEAWFAGAVAESYPVQAGATHLVVMGHFEGELPTPSGLTPPD